MVSLTSTATICGSIFLAWSKSRTDPPEISSALPLILTCMEIPNKAKRLNNFNTLSKQLLPCQGNGNGSLLVAVFKKPLEEIGDFGYVTPRVGYQTPPVE